jgi:hypothetical protein
MTPAQAIASLDSQLAAHGEVVSLQHMTAGAVASTDTPKAFVRDYRSDELVGAIEQGDRKVILSATGVTGLPKANDRVVVAGRTFNVQAVETVRLAGTVVRHNLRVRG